MSAYVAARFDGADVRINRGLDLPAAYTQAAIYREDPPGAGHCVVLVTDAQSKPLAAWKGQEGRWVRVKDLGG